MQLFTDDSYQINADGMLFLPLSSLYISLSSFLFLPNYLYRGPTWEFPAFRGCGTLPYVQSHGLTVFKL
jgi:hypothetical protein